MCTTMQIRYHANNLGALDMGTSSDQFCVAMLHSLVSDHNPDEHIFLL
jgi:hypothetical protein